MQVDPTHETASGALAPTCRSRHFCERAYPGAEPCLVCDLRDRRARAVAEGRQPSFLVVAWGVSRHFGGREEGGWWYDMSEVLDVRRVYTFAGALKAARALRAEYPQPRYNRFSAANRGESDVYVRVVYGETDPRMPQTTTERPRYE